MLTVNHNVCTKTDKSMSKKVALKNKHLELKHDKERIACR